MSEEPKILASISGGKDSLAALITHIESGGRCDGAVYCRIMFDDETSAEYPEHEDFLFNKCFPTIEREYGVKTTIVQQSYTLSAPVIKCKKTPRKKCSLVAREAKKR